MRCHSAHYLDFNPRATYKGGGVGYKAKVTGPDATEPLRYRLQFSRTKVTLTFKPVNYPLYPDSYMHSLGLREYYRNCEIFQSTEPILELLLAETTQYVKFLEGSDETSQPLIGEPFQGQTAERLEKISFWLAWYGVPFDYLTTPANPYNPVKITAGIGKVNENDGWLTGVSGAGHFRKGTLLMEAPRLRRRRQNARVVNDGIAFVYDVFFPFIYFDPEAGETNPRFRGWNLFPFARTGKFFSAARMGDVTKPVVPFYDFDRLFDHANKP